MSEANFSLLFQSITGKDPFPWQSRLYEDFRQGVIPPSCDLPTGLGKTSVIPIWLLALAAKNDEAQIPRRLVYVVNRRTIVDQSSQVAYDLCEKLKGALKDQFS
ncbi:MAG TPA: type I-U CRISPR-associated helicase/endonuclease Cas3, partial [Candidatus Aminicenantes bacterium]|nr:type I-U CRISPR-associated helicase/endonuclease Cas3 [Candidatus Aminicenantes bacterium]